MRDHGGPRRQPLVHRGSSGGQDREINPTTDAITEYPDPLQPVSYATPAITAGPDGNLWFTDGGHQRSASPPSPRRNSW